MTYRTMPLCAMCTVLFCVFSAASESLNCPETVDVQQQLAASIEGWTAILDDTPHRLANVTFYDGSPEKRASLVNDKATHSAGKEIAEWHFVARTRRPVWLACSYAGTAVVLTRMLPSSTRSCSVMYNSRQRVAGLPIIESIACK